MAIIIVLLSCSGLLFKRDRFVFFILLIIGSLVMGLNYDNPDYENYVISFDLAEIPESLNIFQIIDIGYKIFQSFIKNIGISSYPDFRLILSIILFIIFGKTISSHCCNRNTYLAIFIIFYLALDEIQIRNFTSFVILLPFFIYYINNQTLKGVCTFLIGILLAFIFHFSAIFYTLFILLIIDKSWIKWSLLVLGILIFIVIQEIADSFAIFEHVEHYNRPSVLGALMGCFLPVANYYYIRYIKKRIFSKENSLRLEIVHSDIEKTYGVIVRINYLLLFLVPLVFMNGTILRLFRFISLIDIIYLLNIYSNRIIKKNKKYLLLSIIIYAALISMWFSETGVYESLWNNPIFD